MKKFHYLCSVILKTNTIMTRKQKEKDIEKKVRELIKHSVERMHKNISRAIESGAIEINKHEDDYIIPRIIFLALLKDESFQNKFYSPIEKERKAYEKEVDNLFKMLNK